MAVYSVNMLKENNRELWPRLSPATEQPSQRQSVRVKVWDRGGGKACG